MLFNSFAIIGYFYKYFIIDKFFNTHFSCTIIFTIFDGIFH